MIILGIETACDETSASVVENGTTVKSYVCATSSLFHQKTGGVVPEVAARKQVEFMIPVLEEALFKGQSNSFGRGIDAVAVSNSPGLIGSLLVGVETAKALGFAWEKPVVPVNHLKGHVFSAFLNEEKIKPNLPLISLVASGGHTELYLMKTFTNIVWLGGTRDDAAGEAFDKVARVLSLGYPGGPAIDAVAAKTRSLDFKFPRPLINSNDFDFSFSGLKTHIFSYVSNLKARKSFDSIAVSEIAYEFTEAVVDVLVKKTVTAARKYNVKTICVGGGVSANKRLRERMSEFKNEFMVIFPPIKYCMDNAAMIAAAAYFDYKPKPLDKIGALPTVDPRVLQIG